MTYTSEDNCVTPCYIFDEDQFINCIRKTKISLKDIPLTYSIKANPLLTVCIPDDICYVEVCSPGELKICKSFGVEPDRILYSGVVKGEADIIEAFEYSVGLFTAESIKQFETVANLAKQSKVEVDILLRLSSGNQFGMSEADFESIIMNRDAYECVNILGLHYYGGTQKKDSNAFRDEITKIVDFLDKLKRNHGYNPKLIEYGPGLYVDYFGLDSLNSDQLLDLCDILNTYRENYPIGIEMGRFLASKCGKYITEVKDIKTIGDTTYVLVDGGIHHLNYYGQKMGMRIPEIRVMNRQTEDESREDYCICGSLCTAADILVRKVQLPGLSIGDKLVFNNCGAYSANEAMGLFLSRKLPAIYVKRGDDFVLVRESLDTYSINIGRNAD